MAAHAEETPGVGTPIALLHGILDGPDVWRPVAARLHASGRRVMLVHSRAHGEATPYHVGTDWSPLADAEDVRKLLREPVHLVGHSRGGTTAGWLALDAPEIVRSLAVVASPPHASEVFRAHFAGRLAHARDERERSALTYLAHIPDDDFAAEGLRRYRGPALVVEYEDDPLYSPTHTMFWRMFLPYAAFERVPGAHRAFAEDDESAEWLAARLLRHVEEAEGGGS